MSDKWDDLAKEKSPLEKEKEAKIIAESEKKDRYLQKNVELVGGCWTYERIRLDKVLGWKKTKEKQDSFTYNAGKEIVKTSASTYEVRNKTAVGSGPVYYTMQLDKTEIKDWEKYKKLEEEVSDFLSEAQKKMGHKVSPALFRDNECMSYLLFGVNKTSLIVGGAVCGFAILLTRMLLMMLPVILLCVAGGVFGIYIYRKKRADYLPLIEAYFEKINEFEEKMKEIRN